MINTIATKRGIGIELWGTYNDLSNLYYTIEKFWTIERKEDEEDFENRDKLISGFVYELRKAFEGSRLKRKSNQLNKEGDELFGAEFSWIHILFSLVSIRHNMRYIEVNKDEIELFEDIESNIQKSLFNYDSKGAISIIPFFNGAVYSGNKYIYQYMRCINAEFFLLGGGKKAFRQMPKLLNKAIYNSSEYIDYLNLLTKDAKKYNCEINELELNDDHIDYMSIKW